MIQRVLLILVLVLTSLPVFAQSEPASQAQMPRSSQDRLVSSVIGAMKRVGAKIGREAENGLRDEIADVVSKMSTREVEDLAKAMDACGLLSVFGDQVKLPREVTALGVKPEHIQGLARELTKFGSRFIKPAIAKRKGKEHPIPS